MIKVIEAGFYSTIQDSGRFGFREYGVPVSGTMDQYASKFANLLLGNDKNAAVLEMTMTGPKLEFSVPTNIVVSGAQMQPKVNGKLREMNSVITINSLDLLSFDQLQKGFRAYLAIEGGFNSELVLGSQSMLQSVTNVIRISRDDTLLFNFESGMKKNKNASVKFDSSYAESNQIDAFKGPEFEKLTKEQQELILCHKFKISKYNSRMAYQLEPNFENQLQTILTAPVLPGTVQLTPSGQLIILMRDCQTTGGYPRILQLTENAINNLSQKTTGNRINFRLTE